MHRSVINKNELQNYSDPSLNLYFSIKHTENFDDTVFNL